MKKSILFTLALALVLGLGLTSCKEDKVSINKTWELSGELSKLLGEGGDSSLEIDNMKLILDIRDLKAPKFGLNVAGDKVSLINDDQDGSIYFVIEEKSKNSGIIFVVYNNNGKEIKEPLMEYKNLTKKNADFIAYGEDDEEPATLKGVVTDREFEWVEWVDEME